MNPQRLHANILRLCRLRGTHLSGLARETGLSVECVMRAAGTDPNAPADHKPAQRTINMLASALGISPGALVEADTDEALESAMRSYEAAMGHTVEACQRKARWSFSSFWRHFICQEGR